MRLHRVDGGRLRRERRGPFRRAHRQTTPAPPLARSTAPATPARALVTKYCVTCHNERLKTASLLLDKADAEQVVELGRDVGKGRREAAKPRDAARRACRARTTPPTTPWPRGSRRSWIAQRARVRIPAGRRISIGSIARNTPTRFAICSASRSMRASMLPPDAQAHGFDTNADALVDRAGAAGSLSDRGREDRAPRRRRPDASARPSSATPPSRATRTSRPGCGRPSGSARLSRWGRAAGSRRATTSRSMANTSSRFACCRTYAGVIRGLNDAERRSRFASMASASGSSRSAAPIATSADRSQTPTTNAAGARAAARPACARCSPRSSSPRTSRPKGWARSAFRSGAAKATFPAPRLPSRRC